MLYLVYSVAQNQRFKELRTSCKNDAAGIAIPKKQVLYTVGYTVNIPGH
jgi:hypothetical protein